MNVAQSQPSINPWLKNYISQDQSSKSRYEIDRFLIEAGYEPNQIEKAWELLLNPTDTHPAPITSYFTWFRRGLWLVNSFSVSLLLVLYLFASSEVAKEGNIKIFLLTINIAVMDIIVIIFLTLMLGLVLLSGFWIGKRIWHGS